MSFGERLRAARERKNLTQEQVAKHFGISREAVQQWESATIMPRGAKLDRLARLLEVSVQWLVSGSDEVPLSDEERSLVNLYRNAPADSRNLIRELLKKLALPFTENADARSSG